MKKRCLIFILLMTLFTGILGMESHAAESEVFLDPFPIYRMSLTKGEETVMYTAFYVQDTEGNIYLISSAFAGAAIKDGWEATLHTASGEKEVEYLRNDYGVAYLKAEIPEQGYILEIEDDEDYEDGRILCAKKTEEKAENGSVVTKYTWSKWYVDFLGWYQHGSYYINDEIYMSKVYLEDVKLYGAPLVHMTSDNIYVIGTLYLDVNYSPIIVDFRKTGLDEAYAIGKVDVDEEKNEISAFMAEQLNSIAGTDEEIKVTEVSENNTLLIVIAGAAVVAVTVYFKKRKQKHS